MHQGDNTSSRSTAIQFLTDNIIQCLQNLKCQNNFLEMLRQNTFEEKRLTHILISVIEADNFNLSSEVGLSSGLHIDTHSLLLAVLQFAVSSENRLPKQEFSLFCACLIFAIVKVFYPTIQLNSTDCILVLNELLSCKEKYTKGINISILIQKLKNSIPVFHIHETLTLLNKLGVITYNKQNIFLNKQIIVPSICF